MYPQPPDEHRTAIGIIRGMIDELRIRRDENVIHHLEKVVCLDDLLRCVMGELAVADDEAVAVGSQVFAVIVGEGVDNAGNADDIVGAMPAGSLEA